MLPPPQPAVPRAVKAPDKPVLGRSPSTADGFPAKALVGFRVVRVSLSKVVRLSLGRARCSLILLLLLGAGLAEAQKTDSVWIRNGDRITGEVKSLSRALLKYSTDDLGTIYIEWDKVDRISTPTTFEVELNSGQKFFGTLAGLQRCGGPWHRHAFPGRDRVDHANQRKGSCSLDGYLDLGFSYQKAQQAVQLTSGAKVYRGPSAETTFDITTFREDRDDARRRHALDRLTERLLLANRWNTGFVLGYDRTKSWIWRGAASSASEPGRWPDPTTSTSGPPEVWCSRKSDTSPRLDAHRLRGTHRHLVRRVSLRPSQARRLAVEPGLSQPHGGWSTEVAERSPRVVRAREGLHAHRDAVRFVRQQAAGGGGFQNDFGTTLAISWTF